MDRPRRVFLQQAAGLVGGAWVASDQPVRASALTVRPFERLLVPHNLARLDARLRWRLPPQQAGQGPLQNYAPPDAEWPHYMLQAVTYSQVGYACLVVGAGAKLFGYTNIWLDATGALCTSFAIVNASETLWSTFNGWARDQWNSYVWYVMSHAYPYQP
jgi:hypothetical protein